MKKILLTILAGTFIGVLFGADSVMVDNNGTLAYPDKDTFAQKNALVPTTNLSVFVDLYRDGIDDVTDARPPQGRGQYWSDCELKVLDKNGNIIYFFSTILFYSKRVQALHDSKYNDMNARCFYYVSGAGTNACVKPKKEYVQTASSNTSIGAKESAYSGAGNASDSKVRITAIQIYPSDKFREVFLNPENSIMVWRQSPSVAEVDGKGGKLWRPAIIQFIR